MFWVKIRTYSMFHTFYMLLFILWYILNELDTLAYHNEVYILKCQTCATVVIVVGYANKPYRLGDSLKEALWLFAKIPITVIHVLHNSISLFEFSLWHDKLLMELPENLFTWWFHLFRLLEYPNCGNSGKFIFLNVR